MSSSVSDEPAGSPDPALGHAEAAPKVVLGVSGGIAAYKACELLRGLTESGHQVRVVPTESALRFVGAPTWAALSGQPVSSSVWEASHEVAHVRIGRQADLVVVAPASADLLARAAAGMADDLLTATLLTATCPVLLAPAMHTEMWLHPATRANVATLRSRGVLVLEPATGRLTGEDSGPGRLPEPSELLAVVRSVLARGPGGLRRDLSGVRVLVSAGGTREPLDPVRYLGNRSSGRQGVALARAAALRGAEVLLVAAHLEVPEPAGVEVVRVDTTAALREEVLGAAERVDVIVMAAAPADFRPAAYQPHKIKKSPGGEPAPLVLAENPDILSELTRARAANGRGPRVIVGFAAETGDETTSVLEHGRAKLERKGVDLLVVNEVGPGRGLGTDDNAAVLLDRQGGEQPVPRGPKDDLAHAVWDRVLARL